jgi:hypothetical protein
MWYNQYELTYGLTDRIEAAVYLNMAQPRGHGYWYAGSKYPLRGRLFDESTLPVNLSWHVELEWHKTSEMDDDPLELELRPRIEKDIGRVSIVIDPKFGKPIFTGPKQEQRLQVRLCERGLPPLDALLVAGSRVLRCGRLYRR